MKLVLSSKNNKKRQKITKTKTVQKAKYMWDLVSKCKQIGQESARSPKR